MDLPPIGPSGERREHLTRHTSLNGKSGRRKKQLRRRSSGGPETVCLSETHAEALSRLLLRRPEHPDALLARRRGSLPIEVLTVGHSGKFCGKLKNCKNMVFFFCLQCFDGYLYRR